MSASTSQWEETYLRVPLCHVPQQFAGIAGSPFLLEYLKQVLLLCPRGGRTLWSTTRWPPGLRIV